MPIEMREDEKQVTIQFPLLKNDYIETQNNITRLQKIQGFRFFNLERRDGYMEFIAVGTEFVIQKLQRNIAHLKKTIS